MGCPLWVDSTPFASTVVPRDLDDRLRRRSVVHGVRADPRARTEHVEIVQRRERVSFPDNQFHHGDAAARCQRSSTVPQNRQTLIVRPVVEDELEQQQTAGRHRFEEVADDDLCAV